jgi:hypothetical protein
MEPVNVRYAGANGLLVNTSLLLSLTHSGRRMFGCIFRFGRHESYRGLRLELLFCLTV